MSRTVSARLTVKEHEDLRERCNKLGCSINDFVAEAIKFMLYNYSDFEFEDPDENQENL